MLLLLAMALAADPAVAPAPAAAKPASEKKICRREDVLGSYVPRKTCRTAEEWREIEKTTAANVDRFNNDRANGRGIGGSGD